VARLQQPFANMRADEARAARHQEIHARKLAEPSTACREFSRIVTGLVSNLGGASVPVRRSWQTATIEAAPGEAAGSSDRSGNPRIHSGKPRATGPQSAFLLVTSADPKTGQTILIIFWSLGN
jgi:hypothetical protein